MFLLPQQKNRCTFYPSGLFVLIALALICMGPAAIAQTQKTKTDKQKADIPTFDMKLETLSKTGYVSLKWEAPASTLADNPPTYELQEAPTSAFNNAETIYNGPNDSLFLSGLRNGTYYYRLRSTTPQGVTSPWSKTLILTVKHHSQERAWILFILGGLVFLATLYVLVKGHLRTKEDK